MSEIADRFRRRADEFERKITAMRPDQWPNQSPCEHWTARDVVGHIVDMLRVTLRPLGRGLAPAPSVADDPLAAFVPARADVQAVLDDPELARVEHQTPIGKMPVAEHIDRSVSDDIVLHGWDLARATGQPDAMDPGDVERIWAYITTWDEDFLNKLRTPGAFGPGVEVFGAEVPLPADAPLQDRLLAFIGRDPR